MQPRQEALRPRTCKGVPRAQPDDGELKVGERGGQSGAWPAPAGKGVVRKGFTWLEVSLEEESVWPDTRGRGKGQAGPSRAKMGKAELQPGQSGGHLDRSKRLR